MLLVILYGVFSMVPLNSAIINCRIACRRCRENAAYPDVLEVYCAMCDECKERRREWLEGVPSLNLRDQNGNHLKHNEPQDFQVSDECSTTPHDEQCDEPILLSKKITSSTTSTTSTTNRPCTPKPHCIKTTTKAPCLGMPCPVVPIAIPMCPLCPLSGATTVPSSSIVDHALKKNVKTSTATSESMYFYVGVPKKLLKDLQLLRS